MENLFKPNKWGGGLEYLESLEERSKDVLGGKFQKINKRLCRNSILNSRVNIYLVIA